MGHRVDGREMQRRAVVLLDEAPTIKPEGAFFRATYVSGDVEFSVAVKPHDLLVGIERATRAYNEWAATQHDACPIKRRG